MSAIDGLKVLERVEFDEEEDDNFRYELIDDNNDNDDEEDDLADALASLQLKQRSSNSSTFQGTDGMTESKSVVTHVRPSVVDDFIRNFLIKAGMKKALESFNTEWYELQSKGKLPSELCEVVPDIYLRNEDLDMQTRSLREQVDKMRAVAGRAQATWDKFRKERDYHRMHHRRVVQEKNKLIDDLKRLRGHLRSYEPTIEELKRRYELAMKEKMMTKLERDRLRQRVKALEEQVTALTQPPPEPVSTKRSATRPVKKQASFPAEETIKNPFADMEFDPVNFESYTVKKSYKGHVNSVSACAFHPKKPIFATASDDETWKLWTVQDSSLVMSGEGHTSWLSGVHFHPHGSHLLTSSGDGTVKIWEFAQARCSQTFSEHTQAVWGCEFHYGGDFFASCSMDQTIRIWDLISGKCRQTLRDHVDSVNAICWEPYTSNICSASGDKTVSVWDARTGLCTLSLFGHDNAVNSICCNNLGNVIISSDADGIVRTWDIRMVKELSRIETGNYPVNKVTVDRSGQRVLAASDDGTVKVIDILSNKLLGSLPGHDAAVQCVAVAPNDSYFVSGSSDCTFKVWGL